jgi:hypothetical protein
MPPTPRRDLHPPRKPLKSSIDRLEYNRKRYWDNREENLIKAREYYEKNKEKVIEYQKLYVGKYSEETKTVERIS